MFVHMVLVNTSTRSSETFHGNHRPYLNTCVVHQQRISCNIFWNNDHPPPTLKVKDPASPTYLLISQCAVYVPLASQPAGASKILSLRVSHAASSTWNKCGTFAMGTLKQFRLLETKVEDAEDIRSWGSNFHWRLGQEKWGVWDEKLARMQCHVSKGRREGIQG